MASDNVVKLRKGRGRQGVENSGQRSRHVLLLQGPVGPFFARLHEGLELAGFQVTRVTFGPADRHFNRNKPAVRFRGSPEEFKSWLEKFTQGKAFGAVVLFGATRPVHAVAGSFFREAGVPVLSLEEGYLRSGYITAELGGNNFQSPFAGVLDQSRDWSELVKAPASSASAFTQLAKYGFAYYAMHSLFAGYRERQSFHKRHRTNIIRELYCWARNYARSKRHGMKNMRRIEYLLENQDRNYFVVPFQVSDDAQLTGAAGNSWTNDSLALSVIESFAKFASPTQHLVFKVHPLERGHSDAYKIVLEIAANCGVKNRVHVVDTGSIGLLTRHSAGMITINSTSGFSALNHGVPLAVLGRAIYAIPELCTLVRSNEDLNRFWKNGFTASPQVRANYINFIKARCLLPGDYYLASESKVAVEHLVVQIGKLVEQGTTELSTESPLPVVAAGLRQNTRAQP